MDKWFFETPRARIFFEPDYISCQAEIENIIRKIDTGIVEIEHYLDIHRDGPIEFYIRKGDFISYCDAEKVILSGMREQKSPYLHETVHVIARSGADCLWLIEGLAVYLNDELGGFPCFPNGATPIDEYAKIKYDNRIHFQAEFNFSTIHRDFRFRNQFARAAFYAFSGSFVKFLDEKIGSSQLLRIYRSLNPEEAFWDITGATAAVYRQAWEEYLQTVKVFHFPPGYKPLLKLLL